MLRFFAILGLGAPMVLVFLLLAAVRAGPLAGEVPVPLLVGLSVLAGASTVALMTAFWILVRVQPVVSAAERIADGDLDTRVPGRLTGFEHRLSVALATIGRTLVDTTNAATTDRLTAVANRPSLLSSLFTEVERAVRYERPLAVGFVDVDLFKNVNDTYGHHAGDLVLRGVAGVLRANVRATDTVGRYGGEEFMLLLPETEVEDAAVLAEKLRQMVLAARFEVDGLQLNVTVSIGVSGGTGRALRVDDLVRNADAAMYSAKALGRNQTYVFEEPDEDAMVTRAPVSSEGRARAAEVGRIARMAAEQALIATLAPYASHRGQASALMATLVVEMGARLGLPDQEIDRLRVASLLHDVGKLALPPEILEKPAALTAAEWQSVVQHPRIGQVILEQASALREAVPIVLHHHERFAGHGYPYGLRGSDIPLGARIVALADAFDAMTHPRPYRRALSHDDAIREIRRHSGTQFDPDLVDLFIEMFGKALPSVRSDAALYAETTPLISAARRRRAAAS